jgi:hypothetical protein
MRTHASSTYTKRTQVNVYTDPTPVLDQGSFNSEIAENSSRLFEEGREIFRYDTFGSEAFWGGKLQLHRAIAGERLGGVGPGLTAKQALQIGLKVDARKEDSNYQLNVDYSLLFQRFIEMYPLIYPGQRCVEPARNRTGFSTRVSRSLDKLFASRGCEDH